MLENVTWLRIISSSIISTMIPTTVSIRNRRVSLTRDFDRFVYVVFERIKFLELNDLNKPLVISP